MSHKAETVLKTELADCTHEMSDKTSEVSKTSEASEASDDWLQLVSGLSNQDSAAQQGVVLLPQVLKNWLRHSMWHAVQSWWWHPDPVAYA